MKDDEKLVILDMDWDTSNEIHFASLYDNWNNTSGNNEVMYIEALDSNTFDGSKIATTMTVSLEDM